MTGCVARLNFHLVMLGYSRVHDSHVTNLKFPPRHRSGWGETCCHVFRWVNGCSHRGCCNCVCLGHTWSLMMMRHLLHEAGQFKQCPCATSFLFLLPHLWVWAPTWTKGWRQLSLPDFLEKSAQSNKAYSGFDYSQKEASSWKGQGKH